MLLPAGGEEEIKQQKALFLVVRITQAQQHKQTRRREKTKKLLNLKLTIMLIRAIAIETNDRWLTKRLSRAEWNALMHLRQEEDQSAPVRDVAWIRKSQIRQTNDDEEHGECSDGYRPLNILRISASVPEIYASR
jgi:hypothetical protein